jgi:hypothetical protein
MIVGRNVFGISTAPRRNRRLMVVTYWLLAVAVIAIMVFGIGKNGAWLFWRSPALFFGVVTGLSGLLGGRDRNGLVRRFPPSREPSPEDWSFMTPEDIAVKQQERAAVRWDERETTLLNAYQSTAYKWLSMASYPMLFVLILLELPQMTEFAPLREPLLWLALIVIWSLPQTLILWNEPDIELDPGSFT